MREGKETEPRKAEKQKKKTPLAYGHGPWPITGFRRVKPRLPAPGSPLAFLNPADPLRDPGFLMLARRSSSASFKRAGEQHEKTNTSRKRHPHALLGRVSLLKPLKGASYPL